MNKVNYFHKKFSTQDFMYSTPNTLEIPENYRDFVNKRISDHLTFNYYIHHLIVNFSYLILEKKIEPFIGIKTKYQDKGLDLFPKKFRVFDPSDWVVLKILANTLNVSRCKLIIMFIEFDMAGDMERIVTTQSHKSFGYQEKFSYHKSIYIRIGFKLDSKIKNKLFDW